MWITPTSVCTQFVLLNAELLTENWKHIIPILQNILKVVKVLLLIWSWRTLAISFILNYTCTGVELTVYTATTFSAEMVKVFLGFMGSMYFMRGRYKIRKPLNSSFLRKTSYWLWRMFHWELRCSAPSLGKIKPHLNIWEIFLSAKW